MNTLINRYEMLTDPVFGIPGRFICPFLAAEPMSIGLKVASKEMIKGKKDRFFLRKAAYDRYGDSTVWNTKKGGAMALTQRAFSDRKNDVENILLNGPLVSNKIIDIDNVELLIKQIAVGAAPCPHALIHLFSANMFIKHWERICL
jgi:hypothetical protein